MMKMTYADQGIKNIIFDLDGTLVHHQQHLAMMIEAFLSEKGYPLTRQQAIAAGQWSHKFWGEYMDIIPDPENVWDDGAVFWRHYVQRYYQILDAPEGSLDELLDDLAVCIDVRPRDDIMMLPQTVEVLSALKAQGFRMGILSNRESLLAPVIEALALSDFIEHAASAGELGASKPEPEAFYLFLEVFGGKPEESLYVGDNYFLDVEGALNAGLKPVLLDRFGWYEEVECPIIAELSALLDLV
jgi:FMN phosphatase YigB (HAD superfamily)